MWEFRPRKCFAEISWGHFEGLRFLGFSIGTCLELIPRRFAVLDWFCGCGLGWFHRFTSVLGRASMVVSSSFRVVHWSLFLLWLYAAGCLKFSGQWTSNCFSNAFMFFGSAGVFAQMSLDHCSFFDDSKLL